MSNFAEISAALRARPGGTFGRGASQGEIDRAEEILGSFPSDYREFLRLFGWADFDGEEISGLGGDLPWPHLNVVLTTLRERELGGLPARMVAFYNDGGGNIDCFEAGAEMVPEGVIYCFFHEDRRLYRDADSFGDFVAKKLAKRSA